MKVAWYDTNGTGRWRDFNILMHWPYTVWHLCYVVIGASLVDDIDLGVLVWTLVAFFSAMGVGAHALDELKGRPLKTGFSDRVLWIVGMESIACALLIGAFVGVDKSPWIISCMSFGGFIVIAYNLELWFFHRDEWFALSWGAFPVITAYVAQTGSLNWTAVGVAAACFFLSVAQRNISMQVRFWRRKVTELTGTYQVPDPPFLHRTINKNDIIEPPEKALKWMTWGMVALAAGLLLGGI